MDSKFGLSDTIQSFFFSPKKPVGGWILGAGPTYTADSPIEGQQWGVRFGLTFLFPK